MLLLISAVIFLLVLARLNSCLFKPLLAHMDERSESIKKDLENAKNNAADVEGILAEASEIISKAKKEAAAVREDASKEANDAANTKLSAAKSEIESKYNDFVQSLEAEKTALKSSLVSQMPLFQESLKNKLSSI
jgi:F-type H+-transporting ATPase subunit b